MHKHKQWLEALKEIKAEDETRTEIVVPVSRVTAEVDGLHAAGELIPYDGRAFGQLCACLRRDEKPPVPTDYLGSLPGPMAAELARHELKAGVKGGDTITIHRRGAEVIGLGDPNLVQLSGTDVFEAVMEGVGGRPDELTVTDLSFDGHDVRFDIVTQRSERAVRVGDFIRSGLSVTHSLIGGHATRVEGYVLRIKCLNGAINRECLRAQGEGRGGRRTRRLGAENPRAKQQQRDQLRGVAAEVFERLNERTKALSDLAEEPADLEQVATNWLLRSRLSPERYLPLLEDAHEMEGAEPTAYGVLNAFTRVATHRTDLPRNVRNILARMGGLLAFGHSRLCSKCWSLIAADN